MDISPVAARFPSLYQDDSTTVEEYGRQHGLSRTQPVAFSIDPLGTASKHSSFPSTDIVGLYDATQNQHTRFHKTVQGLGREIMLIRSVHNGDDMFLTGLLGYGNLMRDFYFSSRPPHHVVQELGLVSDRYFNAQLPDHSDSAFAFRYRQALGEDASNIYYRVKTEATCEHANYAEAVHRVAALSNTFGKTLRQAFNEREGTHVSTTALAARIKMNELSKAVVENLRLTA